MRQKDLFLPLILLNIAAVLIGFFYYSGQLSQTPPHLLFFVPDCPLYVLLFLIAALGIVKNDSFSFLVSAGMAKYGLWTVFVLIYHWDFYSQPAFLLTTLVFIAGHTGMALEGLSALPKKRMGALLLAATVAWFLLNDFADYALGTVPPIPREGIGTVALLTILSSLAIPLSLYLWGKKILAFLPVSWLAKIVSH